MANRKLVLDEKDGSVLIGVSAKDCDPLVRTVQGDLEAALEKVPAIPGDGPGEMDAVAQEPGLQTTTKGDTQDSDSTGTGHVDR